MGLLQSILSVENEPETRGPTNLDRDAIRTFYKESEDYASHFADYGLDHHRGAVNPILRWLKPGQLVLDVGCGCGQTTEILSEHLGNAFGCDLSLKMLREGKTRGLCNQPTAVGDVIRLPFRTESVDAITSFEMIEHVPDIPAALREMVRVLKSGGLLYIHAPNTTSVFDSIRDIRDLKRGGKGRNWLAETMTQAKRRLWRNVGLTIRKLLWPKPSFVYVRPDLDTEGFVGGDRDLVYYSSPIDIVRELKRIGVRSVYAHRLRSPEQRGMSPLAPGSGIKTSLLTRLTWPFESGIQIVAIK